MLRRLFLLIIVLVLAWLLGDKLTTVFHFLPIDYLARTLIPKDLAERDASFYIGVAVWAVLFWFLLPLLWSLLGFAVPNAQRFSATKLARRIQGFTTELMVFVLIFVVITGLFMWLPWNKRRVQASLERESYIITASNVFVLNRNLPWIDNTQFPIESMWERVTKIHELRNIYSNIQSNKIDLNLLSYQWNGPTDGQFSETFYRYLSPILKAVQREEDKRTRKIQTTRPTYESPFWASAGELDEATGTVLILYRNGVLNAQLERPDFQKMRLWQQQFPSLWKLFSETIRRNPVVPIFLALIAFAIFHFGGRFEFAGTYVEIARFFHHGRFGFGGSGRFAGMCDEWAELYRSQKNGLFMGRSLFNPLLYVGLEDKRHMLTIAGSRAGKGATAIIPNLLLWPGSALVIDPKGTNAAVTARRRREMGQNVYLIDPFGLVKKDGSDGFNPLAAIDPKSPSVREEINRLAEALVVPDAGQKDKHWDDGARTVLAGLIGHIISSGNYPNPNLAMVRNMMRMMPEDQAVLWADMSLNEGAGGIAHDAAARIIRGIKTTEMLGILSNVDKHTEWLASTAIQSAMNNSTFSFAELKEKPTTIYLILPPHYLETHRRFLRMFVNLAIGQMSIGGRSKTPVLMVMDEFLSLGRMEEVEKAFGLMAGYNLILWPFVQDLGRLKDLYGSSVNAFITNSRAVQVFGVFDDETTKYVSDQLGGRSASAMFDGAKSGASVPMRTPVEVSLDVSAESGRQYVLRAGKTPLLLEKVPYFEGRDVSNEAWPVRLAAQLFGNPFQGKFDRDPDY